MTSWPTNYFNWATTFRTADAPSADRQLAVELSWVELCRYKRGFKLHCLQNNNLCCVQRRRQVFVSGGHSVLQNVRAWDNTFNAQAVYYDVTVNDSTFTCIIHRVRKKSLQFTIHNCNKCTVCGKKSIPWNCLPFSKEPLGIFTWNFTCLLLVHVHIEYAKRHLIAFNYCKVTEFFVWPPSDFCTFKNLLTEKTALK